MLRENEFKIVAHNLKLKDANETIVTILKLIEEDQVRAKYTTIHKGENSIDISMWVFMEQFIISAEQHLLSYIKDRKKNDESFDNNKAFGSIIRTLFDGTRENPHAEISMETNRFTIKISNGMVVDEIPKIYPQEDSAIDTIKPAELRKPKFITCPDCNTRNDLDAIYCKHCGIRMDY